VKEQGQGRPNATKNKVKEQARGLEVKEHQSLRKVVFINPPGEPKIRRQNGWQQDHEFRAVRGSGGVYDCVIPKIDFNKGHPCLNDPAEWFVRLQMGAITEEKAREVERYWREQYKTWDKQKLEDSIKDLERDYTFYVRSNPEEDGQQFKYEIRLQQQELQRRQSKSD
jgi:hypothetical protein